MNGATRMTDLCTLITSLHKGILENAFWDHQSARILRALSTKPKIAFRLYSSHFRYALTDIFKRQENAWKLEDLLYHLSNLICINPEEFIELGYFEMLHSRVKDIALFDRPTVNNNIIKFPIYAVILKCFALLINCRQGQEKFMEVDGVELMFEILATHCIPDWIYEFATLALQNGTICKVSVWRSKEFRELPIILLRMAHHKENDALQLYALKCLRNLTSMPRVKTFVRNICMPQIKKISCRKPANKKAKDDLIKWLKSKKYVNIEEKVEICQEPQKSNKNCICYDKEFQKLIDGNDSD